MKKILPIVSLVFLCSCASLHTPSPHFVPSISKKSQFEGEANFGIRVTSVNFAYSPLQRLTVMGSVQGMPLSVNSANYQRSCEVALGTYGSRKRFIYGLNCGYGLGAYNWRYDQFNDTVGYSIYTHGDFQKLMAQVFFALTDNPDEPKWLAGISLKGNYYWDQYASLSYTTRQQKDFSGLQQNTSFEPCLFTKNFFTRRFYLNAQAGMNISYDQSMFWPLQYVFLRVGLGLKL